jgi:DNA-binding response OmpR family regulator
MSVRRILLIDDNAALRQALTLVLERAGYAVRGAADGNAGLRLLWEHGADLVITDVQMPDGNGIEVVIAIRRGPNPVPVLAISGDGRRGEDHILRDAKRLGAVGFLHKPFTMEELLAAVRAAVGPPISGPESGDGD